MNWLTAYAVRSVSRDTRNADRLAQWAERWRAKHGSYPESYTQHCVATQPDADLTAIADGTTPTVVQQNTAEILIHPQVFRRLRERTARQAKGHPTQAQAQS